MKVNHHLHPKQQNLKRKKQVFLPPFRFIKKKIRSGSLTAREMDMLLKKEQQLLQKETELTSREKNINNVLMPSIKSSPNLGNIPPLISISFPSLLQPPQPLKGSGHRHRHRHRHCHHRCHHHHHDQNHHHRHHSRSTDSSSDSEWIHPVFFKEFFLKIYLKSLRIH